MPDLDCRTCKRWQDCKHAGSWFHYGQIRFCPLQIIWIRSNSETLRAGDWPKDPGGSDDSRASRQVHSEGYFVGAVIVISEVEARLKTTHNNGELLITQIEDGRTLSNFSDGARAILMYVSGRRRKRIAFRRWLKVVYGRSKTVEKGH